MPSRIRPHFLPRAWGALGQYLPIGAAGNATRSVAFFDGAGIAHSVWVLLGWVVIGSVLMFVSSKLRPRD